MVQIIISQEKTIYRKWLGVFCFFIEATLFAGTIFGLPGLFQVLSHRGIYQNKCLSSTKDPCDAQKNQYQNALTVGIACFNLPLFLIGIFIDRFGCRFVKLIAIIFHMIGWLSLAFLKPGRDSLLYVHCAFSALSGSITFVTSLTASDYFSKSRALVSSLLTGAVISATMWYSIFEILVEDRQIELSTLAYIWLSFGLFMLFTSFLFLDWNYSFLNLPYQFDKQSEIKDEIKVNNFRRHLTSPLYLLLVAFLSILLISTNFLSILWQPWISYITKQDQSLVNQYTFEYTMSTIAAIVICPINGYLLGFRADRSEKQKLLNISVVQTIAWLFNIALCLIVMFPSSSMIVPVIIINCFARSTLLGGCQAVICTFFPSEYIGRLTGIMWTIVGIVAFVNFGLVKLTDDMSKAWRVWVIILASVMIMSCHLIQIWMKYFQERKQQSKDVQIVITRL
ncbi:hypothetical protein I4U23_022629 [Adineta vaga]|nr:hypothetical protein I4U23_022629 [Adineta vaga]